MWSSSLARLAVFGLIGLLASAATARPFGVEDLLKLEILGGEAAISPDQQTVLVQKTPPHAERARWGRLLLDQFGWDSFKILKLKPGAAPELAFPQASDAGYNLARRSPDGRREAILVFAEDRTQLGVYDFKTGAYREFDVCPDIDSFSRPEWVDDHRLVLASMPCHRPWSLIAYPNLMVETPKLFEAMQGGKTPSATVIRTGPGATPPVVAGPGGLDLVDVETGAVKSLARGDFLMVSVAPKGRWVAAVRKASPILLSPKGPADPQWRLEFSLFDVDGGRAPYTPCPDCDMDWRSPPVWSVSGDKVLLTATASDGGRALMTFDALQRRLDRTPAAGFERGAGQTAARAVNAFRPQGAWLGETLVVRAGRAGADGRRDWYAIGSKTPRNLTGDLPTAPGAIWTGPGGAGLALAGAQLWRVSLDHPPERLFAAAAGRSLSLAMPEGQDYPDPLGRIALPDLVFQESGADGRTVRVLATDLRADVLPASGGELMDVGPGGMQLVAHRGVGAGRVEAVGRDGARTDLLAFNTHLQDVEPGRWVSLSYSSEGRPLETRLLLPPTYQPGQRLPLIVDNYPTRVVAGSTGDISIDHYFPLNLQILAGQGYAVLVPSMPLNLTSVDEEPYAHLLEPVLRAVDAAVAAGYADPDRVAAQGQSFGGYGAEALATLTDRFRAIVATAGFSDAISTWGAPPQDLLTLGPVDTADFWRQGSQEGGWINMGGPPWAESARYVRNSPLLHADRITTPLLLVEGSLDYPEQAQEMIAALHRQGKTGEYVCYWGEGHVVQSPANIRDMWHRILGWYAAYLTPKR